MFRAFGLYTHIRANRIKSVLILCGFVVLILVITYALDLVVVAFSYPNGYLSTGEILGLASRRMREDWIYAVAFSLTWFAIAFTLQGRLIDAATGATLPGPAEQRPRVPPSRAALHQRRHADAEDQGDGDRGAQRLRLGPP